MEETLVVAYEAPTAAMSQLVKEALEQAEVPVLERVDRSPYASDFAVDFSVFRGRYSCLLAPASWAEKAREIVADFLAAYERGKLILPEEPQDERKSN